MIYHKLRKIIEKLYKYKRMPYSRLVHLLIMISQKMNVSSFMVYLKGNVQKFVQEELEPIRTRRKEFEKYIPEVYKILREGSEKARMFAAKKIEEVKSTMKINYFNDYNLINNQVEKYSADSKKIK